MKKSTRLIIGLVIVTMGLVAAIPVTMKYKLYHSDFTRINPLGDFPFVTKYFDKVHVLKVSGLSCDLVSADSFSLELEERIVRYTRTEQRDDTLFVSAAQGGGHLRIFSKDLSVIAEESDVTVRGSYDPYNIASYFINLHDSKLYTKPIGSDHRIRQHIGSLSVSGAGNSSVAMAGSVQMGKLYLYDISAIELDETVGASDLKVEYSRPVIVKSHSQEGKMSVEVLDHPNANLSLTIE